MAIRSRGPRWLSPVAVTFALRGLVGIAVAMASAAAVGSTLDGLTSLLMAYVFADAVPVLFLAVSLDRRCLMVSGMANISVGLLLLFSADLSAFALSALMGFWAMLTGLLGVLGAGALARGTFGRILFAMAGALAVLLGTALGVFPHLTIATLGALLGGYSALSGLCYLLLGYRLRHSGDPGRTLRARRLA